jgi:hypothetical protein
MDLESPFDRQQSTTARLVQDEVRKLVADALKREVKSILRWRDFWKKTGDAFEAIAKGLTGVGSVLAFAASAVDSIKTADILAFTSGTVGTLGLVMLTYATYASKESKQRTAEINNVLTSVGVTPMVDIVESETVRED